MHDLPDFVYFNHSAHVNKGVGCTTCHGPVDKMAYVWQEKSLLMEWCLECHRQPEKYLRPKSEVYSTAWQPPAEPARARAQARGRVRRQAAGHLLHVPPMSQDHVPAIPVSFEGVRRTGGQRRYWKSLDELADTPAFLEFLNREFPEQASMFEDPKGRREFMTLMGASLALAGLTACTKQPAETILPYVRQPEQLVPGRPLFFATATGHDGYARGILVESHEGRPTKIEGNPEHPASLGGTDVFGQAHVLGLYDPDRSKAVLYLGQQRTWGDFKAALREPLAKQKAKGGSGLRFLTGRNTSPTFAAQMKGLLAAFPGAKWASWEPASRDNARAGAVLAFGEPVEPQYRFDQADVILSLEADFVSGHPASLRLVREFAARRKPTGETPEMNRVYVVEGSPTSSGASADHRLALRSSEIEGFARAVAAELGVAVQGGVAHAWVAPIAKDLKRAGARALVIVGESQPPAVHAIGHAINEALGAVGSTVSYTVAGRDRPGRRSGGARRARRRDAPGCGRDAGDPRLEPGLRGARRPRDRVGARQGAVPHPPRARQRRDGSAQPLAPAGLAPARELERPAGGRRDGIDRPAADRTPLPHALRARGAWRPSRRASRRATTIVRAHWQGALGEADFEKRWNRALHDGVVAGTAFEARAVRVKPGAWADRRRGEARRRRGSRSRSARIRPSSTGASPTSAGCRSCRSRSARSPGTTWRS